MLEDEADLTGDPLATHDIERDVTLPSNQDSKLWLLKVKPGLERQLVMRLTNKLFARLNEGQPLMVLQVFECENVSGVIYVEAHKLSHVEQLTRGISGIYSRGLKMIPIAEMTDIMRACSTMKECPVQHLQWVRVNKGIHKGDLALVDHLIDAKKVLVRMVPRIPDCWLNHAEKAPRSWKGLNQLVKGQDHVRVPQRRFNPQMARDCKKEVYKPLGKSYFVWHDMMFRNGMLYQPISISKLDLEDVCPMLDEVRCFQTDALAREEQGGWESDLDEWDLLPDTVLLKTVRNDKALRVQVGDRCRAIEGQFSGCQGKIQGLTEQGLATMLTEDKIPVSIKIPASQIEKFFMVGESVRLLQGVHVGEAGLIVSLQGDNKHASVLMESSNSELKVPITNLRRREQLDPKHSLSDFLVHGKGGSQIT